MEPQTTEQMPKKKSVYNIRKDTGKKRRDIKISA
jgi:hypothetical protein